MYLEINYSMKNNFGITLLIKVSYSYPEIEDDFFRLINTSHS